MNEAQYQLKLIRKIRRLFPECEVIKTDPQQRQGILDLLILFRDRWAMLEVKVSDSAPYRPNQEYYIEHYGQMSFAAMICPENEAEVLDALQEALGIAR